MLSVIVPAYREEAAIKGNLAILCHALDRIPGETEVIVVSDGNSDDTAAQARAFDDPRVRVIEYQPNHGKGYAVRTGVAEAKGDVIAFIDADMEIDPEALPALVESVLDGADAAIGSKWHPKSKLSYPFLRRLQSRLFHRIGEALFHLGLRDTQTGLKVFWGDALRTILPLLEIDGFAFDLEWLGILHVAGATIVEGPVTIRYTFETTTTGGAALAALRQTFALHRRLNRMVKHQQVPDLPRHAVVTRDAGQARSRRR